MATGWIESMDNYRCLTCSARLVHRGNIYRYPGGSQTRGEPFPVYCPAGCDMPAAYSSEQLEQHRDSLGYSPDSPAPREMPKPPKAP